MQNILNQLTLSIARHFNSKLDFIEFFDGPIEIIIAHDNNGDIGLTSQYREITVFGLGGHQHFCSCSIESDDMTPEKTAIIELIDNLINGKMGNVESYMDNGDPMGGGYEIIDENKVTLDSMWNGSSRLEICIHKNIKYALSRNGKIIDKIMLS